MSLSNRQQPTDADAGMFATFPSRETKKEERRQRRTRARATRPSTCWPKICFPYPLFSWRYNAYYHADRSLHHLELLVLLELALLLGGGVLILLVLGHEVVHVRLGLGELHLVHALTGVPVEEGLAPEHGGELLRHALEQLLDGGRVTDEGARHLEATRRDVADGGLDVVRDPLDEVRRVLVLDVEHLLVDLLHRHAATEDGGDGEVPAVTGVAGGHHVLGVEHLLSELGDGERTVLLGSAAGERRKTRHEEVKTRERHHVDGELAEVGVELAREPEASGDTGHGGGHEVVAH